MFLFLSVIQAIVAAALVGVVLMQRSEGGGLGMGGGGSPGGLMSARGAADLLTRTTRWLAIVFVVLAIVLATMAVRSTSGSRIDDSLVRQTAPAGGALPPADPLAAPAGQAVPAPAAPASAPANDPLSGVQ